MPEDPATQGRVAIFDGVKPLKMKGSALNNLRAHFSLSVLREVQDGLIRSL